MACVARNEARSKSAANRKTHEGNEMDQDQHAGVSRRIAIQRVIGAATGVALISFAGNGARAAQTKLTKSAVNYVDVNIDKGRDCDDCVQFVPGKTARDPGTCKIVDGVISPHGHCIAFSPKPPK
jgi:hypothetical protein